MEEGPTKILVRRKQINIKLKRNMEMIKVGKINLNKADTSHMTADYLTKPNSQNENACTFVRSKTF